MNHQRPVNLDLASLKFPPMAIASILHRLSGMVLFFLLPVMLYLLSVSLDSDASFMQLHETLKGPYYKLMLWVFSAALVYHLLAGIRHMLLDVGVGEALVAARLSALGVIAMAALSTGFLGVWIW